VHVRGLDVCRRDYSYTNFVNIDSFTVYIIVVSESRSLFEINPLIHFRRLLGKINKNKWTNEIKNVKLKASLGKDALKRFIQFAIYFFKIYIVLSLNMAKSYIGIAFFSRPVLPITKCGICSVLIPLSGTLIKPSYINNNKKLAD
jgi:hypothetical protein